MEEICDLYGNFHAVRFRALSGSKNSGRSETLLPSIILGRFTGGKDNFSPHPVCRILNGTFRPMPG